MGHIRQGGWYFMASDSDNSETGITKPVVDEAVSDQEPIHEPSSENEASKRTYPPASRQQRFLAAMIDMVILNIVLAPLVLSSDLPSILQNGGQIPYIEIVKLHIWQFIAFLILNSWTLSKYGQTLGKRFMKIAIATEGFCVPDFNRLIAMRYLPFYLANLVLIASLLPLVDVLMIFRSDRRCLHDMLAQTQVIDVSQAA